MVNEKRLIDANAIPKLFERKFEETEQRILDGETYLDTLAEGFTEADDVILAMPTIDAVEVVRCKDCKHFVQGEPYDPCECMKWKVKFGVAYTEPNGYCHKAERKDNG